ncbi:MAG: hypothetical protein H7Y17_02290 [Chlorobia bacterium]|nr:hypothetical protein [Fimbriimonadaceae bacterium]
MLAVVGQSPVVPVESKVVEAAIFKTGQCLVVREVSLKKGNHRYRLDVLPDAFDGTVWYSTPKNAQISALETKIDLKSVKKQSPALTPLERLIGNINQTVTMRTKSKAVITGRLLSVSDPQKPVVAIESKGGETSFIAVEEIASISGPGMKETLETTQRSYTVAIEFQAIANAPVKARIITLEYGAVWASNYLLDLTSPGQGELTGKAQVAAGSLALNRAKVKVLSGAPNMLSTSKFDLAAGYGSAMSYVFGNQGSYEQFRTSPADPFALLPRYVPPVGRYAAQDGLFRGGRQTNLQGGTGAVLASTDFISYDPTDNSIVVADPIRDYRQSYGTEKPPTPDRMESIYAYSLGELTLARGARLTKALFQQSTTVESLIKWEAMWSEADVVTSVLRVKNTGLQPWTNGPVFIVRENVPLSQVEMPFTSPGKTADLSTGKVQDVIVQRLEREVSRDVINDPRSANAKVSQLVSEFRFSLENGRAETTTAELVARVPGDILESADAVIEKLPLLQSVYNRFNEVKWRVTLQPGEKKELVLKARRID